MSRFAFFWMTLIGSLALDQGVKAWIRGRLHEDQSMDWPWPGIFEIKRVTNQGIAFGMFQGFAQLLTPIAVGIAIFAVWYSYRHRKESVWTHMAMALLAAGALGNLYDRLFLPGVTDMFWVRVINFPVFNVADVCITFATIILLVRWGMEGLKPRPATYGWPSSGAAELNPQPSPDPAVFVPDHLGSSRPEGALSPSIETEPAKSESQSWNAHDGQAEDHSTRVSDR